MNDLRPISLLNSCLKLITKILANRFQAWIIRLIHQNQYGFLKGRSIQDCLAWTFEYILQCQAPGRELIVLKLDFEKEFDTLEHSVILDMLRNKGFHERWWSWIKGLLSSGTSAVLLSGVTGCQSSCKGFTRVTPCHLYYLS